MKWEEIVKIQYNAMQKTSVFYIAILSAIAAFSKQLSLNCYTKTTLAFGFLFVLLQNFAVSYLINVQRQASWAKENGSADQTYLNNKENDTRKTVLWLSGLATFFIIITITLILFS